MAGVEAPRRREEGRGVSEVETYVSRVIDEDTTEVFAQSNTSAYRLAKHLMRKGKAFKCDPCTDGGWLLTVTEVNEHGGAMGRWTDS